MTAPELDAPRLRPTGPRPTGPGWVRRFLAPLWIPLLIVALWFAISAASTSPYFPPLTKILAAVVDGFADGTLLADLIYSVTNILVGLLIGSFLAVILGVVIGLNEGFRRIVDPFLQFARALPQTALIPIVIGAFGIGQEPKIFLTAFACLWPVLLNTIDGVRAVPPETRDVLSAYRVPRMLGIWRAILPAALPQIMAGIRVALAVAIAIMVLSELFSSAAGVGRFIYIAGTTFNLPDVWAGTIVAGLIGYVLSVLFIFVERLVLGWYFESAARSDT